MTIVDLLGIKNQINTQNHNQAIKGNVTIEKLNFSENDVVRFTAKLAAACHSDPYFGSFDSEFLEWIRERSYLLDSTAFRNIIKRATRRRIKNVNRLFLMRSPNHHMY